MQIYITDICRRNGEYTAMIETLNGIIETVNYKQSSSIKLFDNDEYEDYPSHWHTALEIIMPTENIYTLNCSGETIVLREGDILLISPGCIHAIYAPTTGRRIIMQTDVLLLRYLKDIEGILAMISPYMLITRDNYPSIHSDIYHLMLEIRKQYLENAAFSELVITSKLLEIYTLIGKNIVTTVNNQPKSINGKSEEYIENFIEICDYIAEHCSEDLNLDNIANMSGFSKFYFSRLFKQFTNISFYKYVNQKRIAKAADLLIEPHNSITDVALNCGFSSLSSFIRMFKIIKGCTPTEFRNMYTAFYD